MEEKNQLLTYDPSKYAVYQMIDYVLQGNDKKVVQKTFPKMFLIKTEPFQDDTYNCVHFFKPEITENDLIIVKDFFQGAAHRINFPRSEKLSHFLSNHWYILKYSADTMLWEDISQDYSFVLPDAVILQSVKDALTTQLYSEIFSQAFNKDLEATKQKFWFYDTILVNPEDSHINAFLLYENGKPVATGAYYAFDTFSVENIGTLPEARGKGYAQIIVKKLLQEARRLWYHQAALVASEMGAPIYKKLGFTILHETTTFITS